MSKNIVMHDVDGNQLLPVTTSENVFVGAGVTLKEHLQNLADNVPGGTVIVDTELSEESENPVQNKVINTELKNINQKLYIGIGSYDKDTNSINLSVTNFEGYNIGTLFVGVFPSGIALENSASFSVNGTSIGEPNSLEPRVINGTSIIAFGMTSVSGVPKIVYADQSLIDMISNLETETETAISKVNTTATNALNMVYDINRLINRKVYYGVATYDSDNSVIDLTIPDYTQYYTGTLFFGDFETDIELTKNTAFSVNGSYIGEPGSLLPRQISAGLVPFVVKTVSGVPRVVFLDDFTRIEYFEQKIFEYDKTHEKLFDKMNTVINPNIIIESSDNVCPFSLHYGLASLRGSGYTSQNGTPTPTAPIEVVGCGGSGTIDISLSKKNLFDKDNFEILKDYTFNDYGEVVASNWAIVNTYIPVKKSSNYVISGKVALANWGVAVVLYNSNKEIISRLRVVVSQSNTLSFETTEDTAYMRFNMYPTDANINTIQIEEGINATTYEEYQGMIVSIPIDSPLYEGDYIEIYADGSGEIVRNNGVFNVTRWDGVLNPLTESIEARVFTPTDADISKPIYCTIAKKVGNTWDVDKVGIMTYGGTDNSRVCVRIPVDAKLTDHPCKIVYGLLEPTRTPLTTEQINEFKKLTTFEGTTHINADGSISVRYYADKVGMLEKELEELKTTLASLVTTNTEE